MTITVYFHSGLITAAGAFLIFIAIKSLIEVIPL